MKAWIVLPLIFIWQALSGPSMGPANIVMKFSERCNFTVPTMVDLNMRLIQKQGKTMLNVTATLPFKYSDKLGFDVNIAVKRNGAWKPNFFKMKGNGLCNGVKVAQRKLFDMFAKSLHAPKPYTCPLPAGSLEVTDYVVDMDGLKSLTGASLPYGELRANVNMTLKNDIVNCAIYYVDIVPKHTKNNG